ncbi:MAG: exosome complex protein Rrp42 [Nitrososphaerota archaeon]|nr:exosome complex protein Rrp42 [Nitrososphaerota archaeon]
MSAEERKHEFVDSIRREQVFRTLETGVRLDGRKMDEYRKIKIEVGPIVKADGSALVQIGNTKALVGVKVLVGTPFPDTPDEGILTVNADILPIASPYEEPGPPDESTIELSRVVDRGIRESHMVDMESLVLEKGKKVYSVFVDVTVLDVDGNLFDAVSYAAVVALATTKYRKATLKGDQVVFSEKRVPLKPKTIPSSVTTAKIGRALVVDPDWVEEAVMDARLTLTFNSNNELCAMQKGGTFGFTPEEILKQMEVARAKAKENRAILKEAIEGAKKK